MYKSLSESFSQTYGIKPDRVFFCPGRVNLMGEHLDYNGGTVMPCSISMGTYLAVSVRDDKEIHFRSLNQDLIGNWNLENPIEGKGGNWMDYPLGIIKYIQEIEEIPNGLNLLYQGDIPLGSGLSSSASLEILTAFALNQLFEVGFSRMDLILMAKRVENEFIGLNSGVMDQFSVTMGQKDKALVLNCQSLHYRTVPIELAPYSLVIMGTNKQRQLSESKYNERVKECETALKDLQKNVKIQFLCDLDLKTFLSLKWEIKDKIAGKRAHHVVSENERVALSEKALKEGNLNQFGNLMYASHESLKTLYEVSGLELDTLVEYCRKDENVLGARMTGAGFGGCAIALIKTHHFMDFKEGIEKFYLKKIGYTPSLYLSEIGDGVHELNHIG